ncbi:hypothetical protein Poli38472_014059 [Pythium oligandrum]|uniref:Impact N-terminal domain-containing protein n=1 Tax=Pythium oligandrum TaxID=41045 RepID=A0A8K1CQD8_PYTOL|nr:hypothetical protein Poli38472_014059 [Pythium oligandrum]|eukprot:TMW66747.1 hypothetical protein Poli38472_014059 [Pythium oligandrum]
MQVKLSEEDGVATLGARLQLKKNVFQGAVVQVRDATRVDAVVAQLRALSRWRKSQRFPHAVRIRQASSQHPSVVQATKETPRGKTKFRASDDAALYEDWDDGGEQDVGDRLLHVLQRWQVENVVLVVARQDDSFSGRLIGQEVFKLMIEAAKLALEQYYVHNMKPTDAAKLELFEATGGAQYLVTPREPGNNASPRHASICLMTTATVPSWPQQHQPTADGGRKGSKKGRVNHFLHGRTGPSMESTREADESTDEKASPTKATVEVNNNDTHDDTGHSLDWLGVTKEEWLQMRSIRVPVKELHYLLMCLLVLVDKPLEKQSKTTPTPRFDEEFTPPSYAWTRCRDLLQQSSVWSERLRGLHGSQISKMQAMALRSVLQEPSLQDGSLVRVASAAVKMHGWFQRLLDEFDEQELGIGATITGTSSPVRIIEQPQPQPPPKPQGSPKHDGKTKPPDDSTLVNELNALLQQHAAKKPPKIVDRGRLLRPSQLYFSPSN